jgi:phosphatidylserine decarboxylase
MLHLRAAAAAATGQAAAVAAALLLMLLRALLPRQGWLQLLSLSPLLLLLRVLLPLLVELPRQLVGEGALAPGTATRISVFMSVFDVHINRAPIAGTVTRLAYVPGAFLNADLDKASDDNERQYFIIEDAAGMKVAITQIAGLVARRILRFVEEGASLKVYRAMLPGFRTQPVSHYLPQRAKDTVLLGPLLM